jgi:hypothetical protein
MAYTTFNTSIIAPPSGAVAFIKDFHDALLAVGLTQTADTGQLDLSVSGPLRVGTSNYSYGYTVYKLSSVSGLDDIFIRVNHTNNSDTVPLAYLPRFTVGTGTDGAGNINANTPGELTTVTTSVGTTSGTVAHYVSVTDGDLAIAFAPTETGLGIRQVYTIARLRNLDGTKRNGYSFLRAPSGAFLEVIYNPARTTFSSSSVLGLVPYLWSTENPDLSVGDDIPVFPQIILTPEAVTVLPYILSTTDIAVGNEFITDRFGVARKYLRVSISPTAYGISNTLLSFNMILE